MALVQAGYVEKALNQMHPGIQVEVVVLSTKGDRKQGTQAASCGDKRDWIHDLDLSIADGSIDLACHCAKDVPVELSEDTSLTSIFPRSDARDALIAKSDSLGIIEPIMLMQENAVLGTASARRRSQLLNVRPDINVVDHRGNVPTRLRKLKNSKLLDGIILASCGLKLSLIHISEPTRRYAISYAVF